MAAETLVALLEFLGVAHRIAAIRTRIEQQQGEERRNQVADIRAAKRAEAFNRELHKDVLSMYYADEDLAQHGLVRYAYTVDERVFTTYAAVRRGWVGLRIPLSPSKIKYGFDPKPPSVARASDDEALEIVQEIIGDGRRVFDRPMYRLMDMRLGSRRPRLDFGLTSFFQFLFGSGLLEDELFQALIDVDLDPVAVMKSASKLLPKRARYLPDAKSLLDLRKRLCVGGAYVLLAFARPNPHNDYVFFAKRRSKAVATGRDVVTLIPMGYHQPESAATAKDELGIDSSVFREISEEIFGNDELISPTDRPVAGWYFDEPSLKWFRENPGHFTFELLSASLNLLQGNYELGVLLAVHDLSYLKEFGSRMRLNWEQDDPNTPRYSTLERDRLAAALGDPSWTGAARMTLFEALRRLKTVDSSRVKMPALRSGCFGRIRSGSGR